MTESYLLSKTDDVQWVAVRGNAFYDRYFVIRSKANVHINVFLTVEPVVIMHWKASFTFQTVSQWFNLEHLTPKRCLRSNYTAFGFNCQLRSCHILVGFLLISPVKPTITSKTKKKAPELSTYPKGREGFGAFSIMLKRR